MTEQYFEEEEFETAFDGRTLVQLLRLKLRHKRWMAVYLVSTLAIAVQEAYLTYLTKRIVDEGLLAGDWPHVVGLVVHYGAVFAAFSIPVVGFILGAGYLGELIRYDLCRDMFARLQQLSLSYFDRTPVGWLMARLTSDSKRIGEMISWGFMDPVLGPVQHLRVPGLHGGHQLEAGLDHGGDHSGSVPGGIALPDAHHTGVPSCPQHQQPPDR